MPTKKSVPVKQNPSRGIGLFLKRVFALMFGAVALTAVSTYATLAWGLPLVFNADFTGFSPLFYIIMFGGLGLSIWAQTRVFSIKPAAGGLVLALYSIMIGFVITPLVAASLAINPMAILQAFIIAAIMFACMALFGYKTAKDLGFLGIFLFIGMIGLILVGVASFIWPLGSTFATIICAIGVLIFALFTAYDMQFLKKAYAAGGDETMQNQLAVLGALHLYISFIAMFQYILALLNRR
ncbi:MAG: Bax inhibitor-1/YccA family protein [Rickettsiales bacterium]|jgi:FtsH-binding integral membrane protein|nr:Bax inhibitor-1/YccA family protein [Rickettsiales bacterium]